jgi:hypothetical protein
MVEALLARVERRREARSLVGSLRSSRRAPGLGQRLQGVAGNVGGSLALSHLRAALDPKRRGKQIGIEDVRHPLERLRAVQGTGAVQVARARHPLTGLPLASIHCRSV